MKRLFVAAACLTVFLSSHALAESGRAGNMCKEDIQKFCKDVKPGEGRIIKCLMDNKDKLSAGCIQEIEVARNKSEGNKDQARDACAGDLNKFCKDVKPGEGRLLQCLKQHDSELSTQCREAIQQKQGK
jgi:hypothetical protein